MVINNWSESFEMTEESSDSLTESLNDQCHIQETDEESTLLVVYANSNFTAANSDQVCTVLNTLLLFYLPAFLALRRLREYIRASQ